MVLPSLVALKVIDRLKFSVANLAVGKFTWAVDHVPMTARGAVVDQYGATVAPNTARLTLVLEFAVGRVLGDPPLLSLLRRAGRGGLDVPDARRRGGRKSAFDWPTWQ